MKKKVLKWSILTMALRTILKTIILTLSVFVTFGVSSSLPSPIYKIGVIQVIEHPALDSTCKGIRDELTHQSFKENLRWYWDSAQGNPALAIQIAQKFIGQEVNLLVAIGTTAAQAALSVARSGNVPVVFASVTDPKGAKLGGNVTGVSNLVPTKYQFNVIRKIMPTQKKIGVIYNPGEANSASLLTQMQGVAKKEGMEIISAAASKTSDVSTAAHGLIAKKVDAIFINNDNTALAAITSVGQICHDNKIPLFASDGNLNESRVLAILGADQYEIGRQAGRIVATIIRGDIKASDIPIEYPTKMCIYLNDNVAQTLGITFSESLKSGSLEFSVIESPKENRF